MKQKMFAAVCAAVLAVCPLAGCGAAGSEEQEAVKMEDLPYGSTITEDSTRNITIAFDKRFLDDALLDRIASYYESIQNRDAEAFKSVVFPLYHNYEISTVYEDKVTEQDLLDTTYDAIKEYFGYDFDFAYLNVEECVMKDGISGERDTMIQFLDDLAAEKGEKKISEDTGALYEMSVKRHVAEKGSGNRTETLDELDSETLYAIQYQGEWYLMYT